MATLPVLAAKFSIFGKNVPKVAQLANLRLFSYHHLATIKRIVPKAILPLKSVEIKVKAEIRNVEHHSIILIIH
jgi:hypothetical protein